MKKIIQGCIIIKFDEKVSQTKLASAKKYEGFMTEGINYRSIKKSDFDKIEKIIKRTWDLNDYSKNRFVRTLISEYDFLTYIAQSNYSVVATKSGKPVGILLARIEKSYSAVKTFKYKAKNTWIKLLLSFTPGGRKYLKECKKIDKIDKRLENNLTREYPAELVLFVVSENYQGNGIGKQLITTFTDYLKKLKINTYLVYTDDFCDVEYYTSHGYTELAKKRILFNEDEDASKFYIFSYNIKNNTKKQKTQDEFEKIEKVNIEQKTAN